MDRYIRVMLATLLIVTGVLVLLPSSYVSAGGGAVVNPSFERGEGGDPDGWELSGNATRVDIVPIYVGNWSAQVTGYSDMLTQWVSNVTAGTTYQVWGWIYVSGNVTGVIAVDFWLRTEEGQSQLSPTTTLSATDTDGEYVQKTGTMRAPAGTTHVKVRLYGTGWSEEAEVVRFDDIGFWLPTGGDLWGELCFIATAAYGTETAAELDILRDFRDQVLLKNTLGSRFVETYYRVSPPVANFIAKNDFLRAVVREMFIDPVVNILQWSQNLWRA